MATLDLQVIASADDCRVYWNGSVWVMSALTRVNFLLGGVNAGAFKQGSGMRFQNVAIPQGAVISTAYLTVTAYATLSGDDVNAVIIGEDVDDAAVFSNIADYQARRGVVVDGANDNYITTASVPWNTIAHQTEDAEYNSPEIKTIIQEIVNRALWASGHALVLFLDDHADDSTHYVYRSVYSYDGSSAKAVKLHIEGVWALGRSWGVIIG